MRWLAVLVLLAVVGLVAACGSEMSPSDAAPVETESPGEPLFEPTPDHGAVYRGMGTVLESPAHGPQLCLGEVAASYPPQCGGVSLVPWNWAEHPEAESSNGTTWGSYAISGTYDGARLTVTAIETDPAAIPDRGSRHELTTPCAPPAGGWAVVDPATATDQAMEAALAAASAEPDYVGEWLDYSREPAPEGDDRGMYDPTRFVLNVQFTGDLDRHEAELREIWGGALCVSSAPRNEAELLSIMDEAIAVVGDGFLSASPDERVGTVEITLVFDDGSLQERFDESYGPGVVVVSSALQRTA